MRARIRSPFVALVSGLLILAAGGCSNASGPDDVQPGGTIELGVVDMVGLSTPTIMAINEAFTEKHPDVRIVMKDRIAVQKAFVESLPKNVKTDPAPALTGVDVVLDRPDGIRFMATFGSLREFPATNTLPVDAKAAQVFDELAAVDGKRYGLPFWVGAPLISVHEGMLAEAGIPSPPLDWTYADFERVGMAAAQAGLRPNLFVWDWLVPVVRSQGGILYDPASGSWAWEKPEVGESLATIARWVQAGLLDPGGEGEILYEGAEDAVMTVAAHGRQTGSYRSNITYRPFPRGPQGRPVLATGLVGAVTAASTHPDLAAEYVRSLVLNPAVRLELARRGYRPVVEDPNLYAAWRAAVGDQFAEAVELAMSDIYFENDAYIRSQGQRIAQTLRPYFTGQTSLENALATLRNEVR